MLPPGFDPATGKLKNINFAVPVNKSTSSYSYSSSYSRHRSWWSRFNEGVASIGNWFADRTDKACTIVMWIALGLFWIGAIIGVISEFVKGNIFTGIILVVVGSVVVYYGTFVIGGIAYVCTAIVLYCFRFLFWNGWTLLITLILTLSIIGGTSFLGTSTNNYTSTTKYVEPPTTTYYCTVNILNIRTSPNTSSSVLGTLQKGDKVEVYEINNGFAKIKYRAGFAYVGADYLNLKNTPITTNSTASSSNSSKNTVPTVSTTTKTSTVDKAKNVDKQYTGSRNSKGQRHGEGTYIWKNGDKYVGNWENDKMSGYGEYTYANGKFKNGIWDNGIYLGTVQEVSSRNKNY